MTGIETQTQKLTGAQIFLECLKKVGVDEIFGYPGGVILTIWNIRPIRWGCIRQC